MSGLKDYYQYGNKPDGHMTSDEKVPKMASAVGILGHLASKHGQDIRKALMTLFEVSVKNLNASFYIKIHFFSVAKTNSSACSVYVSNVMNEIVKT